MALSDSFTIVDLLPLLERIPLLGRVRRVAAEQTLGDVAEGVLHFVLEDKLPRDRVVPLSRKGQHGEALLAEPVEVVRCHLCTDFRRVETLLGQLTRRTAVIAIAAHTAAPPSPPLPLAAATTTLAGSQTPPGAPKPLSGRYTALEE
jgi:hypothetical protein